MQTAYDEPPEDMLPEEVVEFRWRVVDLLWNNSRYARRGAKDPAITAHGFCGRCLECIQPLYVTFDPEEARVEPLVCFGGHDLTERVLQMIQRTRA